LKYVCEFASGLQHVGTYWCDLCHLIAAELSIAPKERDSWVGTTLT
jgi:hypothetical protein